LPEYDENNGVSDSYRQLPQVPTPSALGKLKSLFTKSSSPQENDDSFYTNEIVLEEGNRNKKSISFLQLLRNRNYLRLLKREEKANQQKEDMNSQDSSSYFMSNYSFEDSVYIFFFFVLYSYK
jgi:hypothetical protein